MKKIFKILLYIIISISILGFLFIFLWTKIPEFKAKKEMQMLESLPWNVIFQKVWR